MSTNPILVEAWRGGIVESAHRGAVAIVDADGALRTAIGDVDRAVFPRSAVKALQALPLVASGAAGQLGLSDAELALACASHRGEEMHVRTAASMLAKAGLDDGALECGTHWPYDEAAIRALAAAGRTPGPLHNNCSGKHAGFLCLGCTMAGGRDPRAFVRGYREAAHPVMREVTAALQATTGFDPARAACGVDGCSIPAWAIPLAALARGFARFGTGAGLAPGHARAARTLRAAVAAAPLMVSGSGRFDSVVAAHFGERAFVKVGAEGVYCAALPARGLGVAIKVDDGSTARACEVVMAAVLQSLVAADDADDALLARWADAPLVNWNGIEVGRLAASAALRATLPTGTAP